jgi:hypothetical protein
MHVFIVFITGIFNVRSFSIKLEKSFKNAYLQETAFLENLLYCTEG